mmetsp:Transcript_25142/g.39200  ORF Transcript_25142/g.39200 Transcript_25142/m.39200 type:complete len:319 (-) Transcript_25142:22-978(-)
MARGRLLIFSIKETMVSEGYSSLVLVHSCEVGGESEKRGGVSAIVSYSHKTLWGGRDVLLAGIGKELVIFCLVKSKNKILLVEKVSILLPSLILSILAESNNDEINVLTKEESMLRLLISFKKNETENDHKICLDVVGGTSSSGPLHSVTKISPDCLVTADRYGTIQCFESHKWGPETSIRPYASLSVDESLSLKPLLGNQTGVICGSFSGNIYILQAVPKTFSLMLNEVIKRLSKEVEKGNNSNHSEQSNLWQSACCSFKHKGRLVNMDPLFLWPLLPPKQQRKLLAQCEAVLEKPPGERNQSISDFVSLSSISLFK